MNPLRVLDCKRPECRAVTEGAPRITDYLDEACAAHLAPVRAGPRRRSGIAYRLEPRLVRGLDYYTRTTFEFAARRSTLGPERGGRGRPLRRAGRGPRRPAHARHRLRHRHRAPAAGLRRRGRVPASTRRRPTPSWSTSPAGRRAPGPGAPSCAGPGWRRCAPTTAARSRPSSSRPTAPGRATPSSSVPRSSPAHVVTVRPLRHDGDQDGGAGGAAVVRSGCAATVDDGHEGRRGDGRRGCGPICAASCAPSTSGERVRCAAGWRRRREHGEHLAFVDLRDHTGIVQCVVDGSRRRPQRVGGAGRRARSGGAPRARPTPSCPPATSSWPTARSRSWPTAEPPPFPVDDRADTDEAVRLRYRFVDLRRPRMQRNLRLRGRVLGAMRAAMVRQGFCEVETPLLWTPTPEGAREFAVPSRLNRGKFYVLPQSPQIAKQLLMVGGHGPLLPGGAVPARRGPARRPPVRVHPARHRGLVRHRARRPGGRHRGRGRRHRGGGGRAPRAIERMTWHEAMDRFGVDKPDLRFGMELVDLGEVFAGTEVRAFAAPCVKALRVARRRRARPQPARRPGGAGQGARGQGPGLVQGGGRRRRG